ncbi:16S rRNA (guanine(1207)-N(2))-methyltransferase RsmC [Paraneptunicella aestuarii]|uniref:16S rRNA (guanine(1207)-N(2))-methyltransferase RsmC n=1 Tax=Paraneptunicella aestuarii TaxID=2831148 RepID=UPI001E59D8F9|nr:16S rRNA (guanine(1207)-N(2))-methyltransferase RsmC [Paraneptunicella aestuarii]UAA39118.1 16S rRNA (guanine(1207)-N(2))-methyltransferase RsmC [Paraneptunicella aestuarii]
MLSPESEVILRNKELVNTGAWLLVNATDDEIFSHVGDTVVGFHQFYDCYLSAQKSSARKTANGQHIFSAFYDDEKSFDGAIIYWPKSKQHGLMLCQHIATKIKAQGHLLIVGDNKSGIKSADKALSKIGFNFNKIDSARHCTLLGTQLVEPAKSFNSTDWVNSYSFSANTNKLTFETLPGAFSADALDEGTQLLLQDIDGLFNHLSSGNRVLDFACGNGVIATYIAKHHPQLKLTLSDINSLAMLCAKRNLASNHISEDKAKIVASDGMAEIEGKFQVIVSNPPFHSGIKTDYSITEQFIKDAKAHLTPGGKLRLVANRFLKYPDLLQAHFGNVEVINQNSRFSVYQSHNR